MFDGIAWGITYYFNVNWSPGGSCYLRVSRYGSHVNLSPSKWRVAAFGEKETVSTPHHSAATTATNNTKTTTAKTTTNLVIF